MPISRRTIRSGALRQIAALFDFLIATAFLADEAARAIFNVCIAASYPINATSLLSTRPLLHLFMDERAAYRARFDPLFFAVAFSGEAHPTKIGG